MFKRFLVPIDGSELSEKAVKAAAALAAETDATVILLNVQPPYQAPMASEMPIVELYSPKAYDESVGKVAARILAEASKVVSTAGAKVETVYSREFSPYKAIIEEAARHRCDLIVMASHGRRGLASVVLGSETQKVLAHCTIPVLVHR